MTITNDRPGIPLPGDEARARVIGARRVLSIGKLSVIVRPRMIIVSVIGVGVGLLLFLLSVGISDYPLTPIDVARILLGGGTRIEKVVVFDVSLPHALVSVLVGFGLGLAGSLTQLVARNPLATPDVLGITSGAGAAAVAAIAFGTTWGKWLSDIGIPAAALLGGLATAAAMYLLAWTRRGGIDPLRLVLIGVGLTWALTALTSFMLTRAQIVDVARAQVWLVGSVSQATWTNVWPVLGGVTFGIVVVIVMTRQIGAMQLTTDVARGLGINTDRVSSILLITAVVVAALAVAGAGPIAFVALLAPQIAMRLGRTPVPTPLLSGMIGSILVLGGDLLCRTVLPGSLPVGIVTAGIGGPFLIYLMISMSRKETA